MTGIIIIFIIGALIYFIYKFLKQQQQKNTNTTTTVIDETERQRQDYLFYGNFIKNNTLPEPTSKHVPEVSSVVSFEFENTVDSFDQNFLKVFAYAETYNTIQSQNKFLDSYFNKVLAAEDLDTDVKTRANHAKEYVALVQEIKETLHFIKASQTGYTDDSYYFFINSKEPSGFVDSINEHEWTENTPIRYSLNVERKKRENDMVWVARFEFEQTHSKRFNKALALAKSLPNYSSKSTIFCGAQNVLEYLSFYYKFEELFEIIKNWKNTHVYFYEKPYTHTMADYWKFRERLSLEAGKKKVILENKGISIERLPLPIVYYPYSRGAFFCFSEDIGEKLFFCECERNAIENYLRLRKKYFEERSGLTNAPLSSLYFPEIVASISMQNPENPLSLFDFRPNICHKCNGIIPVLNYCHPMYGSKFYLHYGWYITQKYFELGIDPLNEANTLGLSNPPPNIKTYDYVINLCKQELLYPTAKWKGENQLFNIIKNIYPDEFIMRNYRPDWLNGLELDIFLPNRNLSFEFQGIQHFKPIKFWGGQEQLLHQQENDKRKRDICQSQGIVLITINYNDTLSTSYIKETINHTLQSVKIL